MAKKQNKKTSNSPQKMSKWFENKIVKFCKKIGLKDIGNNVTFNSSDEVDVVAGWRNILFLVECRWSSKKRKCSLRKDIKEIKGSIDSIRRGAQNHKKYSKYNKYKFVLATQNYILRDVDKKYAKRGHKKRRVFFWDENVVRYYSTLVKAIGSYAKFDLFGEMQITPLDELPIRVPAFYIKQEDYKTFVFMMNPKELLKYCYVARREKGETEYYQRIIKRNRLSKIAEYIDNGGFFPNNIIVAINKPCKFLSEKNEECSEEWPSDLKFGILQFPKDYRSMWIVDGQHRLFAYARTQYTSKLPVLAFKKLNLEEQAKFFIDINQNQKSVDPNLMWDLHGEMRPHSEEGIISNAIKKLGEKALRNNIYIPLKGKPEENNWVKLSALCIALKRCGLARKRSRSSEGRKNPLYSKNSEETTKNISRELNWFFKAAKEVLSDSNIEEFVLTNGGIAVMVYIYERLLSSFIKLPKKEKLKKYLKPLDKFLNSVSLKTYIDRITSEGGRNSVLEEFINMIAIEVDDDKLLATVKIPKEIGEKMKRIERNLGSFLNTILQAKDKRWERTKTPPELYKRLRKRKKGKPSGDKRKELHEFLTLGEIKEIINRKDNKKIFNKIFIEKCSSFTSWNEFIGALDRIIKYRNPLKHGGKLLMDSNTLNLINIYIASIGSCIRKES